MCIRDRLGADFGPDTVVDTLSIAERQQVEIARALHQQSHILICLLYTSRCV